MESKKINQLATEMAPETSDLAIIGDPITGVSKKITWLQVSTLIGSAANLQQVTDNGATTTNPIAIGGLTITGLATGVLKSDSGVISSVPFGAANGVATLGGDGKVPSIQLPSYVDDVVEVANYAALPATGETGKIYITLDNNKVYRWTGSIYVEVAADSAVWGAITGTLSNQTDLQNALNTKLSSVGLSMPSGFSVSNSPLTANGTIAVTGAGVASQYIRGDGTLANFPTSSGGGGSVSYYLNGSVNQGTFVGNTYYEMSKVPVIGAGTDFTINANGYISQFITDAGDPALLEIPAGNWNFEMYFSASSGGGSPSFYVELYKYNGSAFTLISSSSAAPEGITNGTAIDLYTTALAVPTTALTLTDRLAVRVYVTHSGRTITLHTENSHLCQVITTFSTGITALNGLTAQVQNLTTGTSGTDFNINSLVDTHTFNLPVASATNTGKLSSTDWSTFNNKQATISLTTTGTSGAATLVGATLNIPNYGSALGDYVTLATNQSITGVKTFDVQQYFNNYPIYSEVGIALDYRIGASSVSFCTTVGANVNGLQVNFPTGGFNNLNFASTTVGNTYTFPNATGTIALVGGSGVGTVTSVAALTLGTTGTDLSSSVANGTTTPVITLNVPTASATNRGALSSTDWSTFNSKQSAITLTTTGSSGVATFASGTLNIPDYGSALSGYLPLTGGTLTGQLFLPANNTVGGTIYSLNQTYASNDYWQIYGNPIAADQGEMVFEIGDNGSPFSSNGQRFRFFNNATSSGTAKSLLTLDYDTALFNVSISATSATFTGNVGIGTSSPSSFAGYNNLSLQASTSGYNLDFFNNSGVRKAAIIYNNAVNFTLSAIESIPMNFETAGVERMRITSGGNVGIGTSSPFNPGGGGQTSLEMSGSSYSTIYLSANSATVRGQFSADNPNSWVEVGARTNHPLLLSTNNTERMRITSAGEVLIGMTSASTSVNGVWIYKTANGSGRINIIKTASGTNSSIANYYSGTYVGGLDYSDTATLLVTTSDYRLKQDLKEFSGLDLVSAIKTYDYQWKIDNSRAYGVIAHEFAEILPYAVTGKKDGEQMQGVDYSKIVPILVKAIQELKLEIDLLKAK